MVETKKNKRTSVKDSEEIYHAIFEAYTEALFLETIEGQIIDCNSGACELYGYQKHELVGLSVRDLVTEDIAATLPDIITEELTTGGIFVEATGRKKDGTVFPTEVSTKLITNKGQKLVIAYVRNITRRRQMISAIKQNEKLLRQIIDLVPHLIFARDIDGRFILVNKAVAEIYDLTVEAIIGKSHRDIHYDSKEVDGFLKNDQKVIRSGKLKYIPEETFVYPDGNIHILQTTIIPFSIVDSGDPAVLGFAMDITDQKLKEEELQRVTDELDNEKNRLKQKNIALREVLSHIEEEKHEYRQKVCQNIKQTIIPILKHLKEKAVPECIKDFDLLENNIEAVLNENPEDFHSRYSKLTPRELEICDMIKKRMASKEISDTLNLSIVTVQKHRELIRKKLGITNKKINLSTYLQIQ